MFCSFASKTRSSFRTTITIDTRGVTDPRRTGRERQSIRRRNQHTYPTYVYATERAAAQNKNFTPSTPFPIIESHVFPEGMFFAECLPSLGRMNQAFTWRRVPGLRS